MLAYDKLKELKRRLMTRIEVSLKPEPGLEHHNRLILQQGNMDSVNKSVCQNDFISKPAKNCYSSYSCVSPNYYWDCSRQILFEFGGQLEEQKK